MAVAVSYQQGMAITMHDPFSYKAGVAWWRPSQKCENGPL